MLDWVKEHPWWTGGGVFAIGVILILLLRGGKSSTVASSPSQAQDAAQLAASGIDPLTGAPISSEQQATAAGNDLSLAQLATQQASAAASSTTTQQSNADAAAEQIAAIQAQAAENGSNNSTSVAMAGLKTLEGLSTETLGSLTNWTANEAGNTSVEQATSYQLGLQQGGTGLGSQGGGAGGSTGGNIATTDVLKYANTNMSLLNNYSANGNVLLNSYGTQLNALVKGAG